MKIGCLQFAPQVGDVDNNLNRADAVLNRFDPEGLDLLVLPEMAFSGYNFRSLQQISPFLEPSGSGITSLWARTSALKYDCTVIVGYPEKVDLADRWPANPEYYNSAIIVSADGETIGNYRKTHLYYTDETWALENPRGFYYGRLPGIGKTAMGICMDLNPYKFEAPWGKFEFAQHVLDCGVRLVVVSMAWITQEHYETFSQHPREPDLDTLMYWVSRLEPIIRTESSEETIVVFANRCGTEEEATYAGTSAVIGIQSGEVRVYGILGRGEKELLVVDTESEPYAKLVYRPEGESVEADHRSEPESTNPEHPVSSPSKTNSPELPSNHRTGQYSPQSASASTLEGRASSSYRRDDLSINVVPDRRFEKAEESALVHTPSAPSPTPESVRPQLKPNPDPHSPPYHRDPSDMGIHPNLLDREIAARRLARAREASPSSSMGSRFSDLSGVSSRRHYMMPAQAANSSLGNRWVGVDDGEENMYDSESGPYEYNNRHSLRSDVSVWNNQPGRPRDIAALRDLVQDPTTPHISRQSQRLWPRAESSFATDAGSSPPRKRGDSVSQKASRSRNKQRSNSVTQVSEMDIISQRLEEIALRAESTHARTYSNHIERTDLLTSPSADLNGNHGRSRNYQSGSSHERTASNGSITIAMDPSVWSDIVQRETSQSVQKPQESFRGSEAPILRPASRSRVAGRSSSRRGRNHERAHSSGNHASRDGARPGGTASYENREISRGRQRATSIAGDQQAQSKPGERPQRSSQRSQNRAPEPVDLSQFRLIEEYPSPNCPIHGHGSRSHSRARHGNPSRRRTSTSGRAQTGSRQGRQSAPAVKNTASDRQRSRTGARTGARTSSRSGAKSAKPAQAPIPVSILPQSKDEGSSGWVDPMTSSASTLSPGKEPKTPVAMVLVAEVEDARQTSHNHFLPPLKCIERSPGIALARPRSSVW